MSAENPTGPKGTRLSAEVKPFLPKQTAVAVASCDLSEASIFPTYLTACYPFVQEPCVAERGALAWNKSLQNSSAPYIPYPVINSSSPADCAYYCSYDSTLPEYTPSPFQYDDKHSRNYNSGRWNKKKPSRQWDKDWDNAQPSEATKPENDLRNQEPKITQENVVSDAFQNLSPSSPGGSLSRKERTNQPSPRKRQPVQRSAPRVKAADVFEIVLSDFPKLGSSVSQDTLNSVQRQMDTSTTSYKEPSRPGSTASTTTKEASAENETCTEPFVVSTSKTDTDSPPAGVGESAKASKLKTALPVSSWASIVSQTPKKLAPAPAPRQPSASNPLRKEEAKMKTGTPTVGESSEREGGPRKKKKEKKKKKSQQSDPDLKTEETPVIVQEPPRFEDTEEFPDLSVAAGGSDRTNRSGNQKFFTYSQIAKKQSETQENKELGHHSSEVQTSVSKQKGKSLTAPWASGNDPVLKSTATESKKLQEPPKKSVKKSKLPMQLDLGDMLAALEQKQLVQKPQQASRPLVFSVGGALPILPKEAAATKKQQQQSNQGKVPHNPLDSSAPLIKKGKQREVPKPKKPSPLKKVILKEREERKQRRLLGELDLGSPARDINVTDHQDKEDSEKQTDPEQVQDEMGPEDTSTPPVSPTMHNSEVPPDSEAACPLENLPDSSLPKIHSRRFRDYCSQILSKEVDSCATELLKELVRFQDRLHQKNPIKAKTKRRIVMGIREVLKHLKLKKLKGVIISPNCEKIQSKGGLDEVLHTIINTACEQNVPFVFALNRKALGRCVNKAVPVSVVGIFSYDGAETHFHKMVELTSEARKAYQEMVAALRKEQAEQEETEEHGEPLSSQEGGSAVSATDQTPYLTSELDEPEYIKIWQRMLENECSSHIFSVEGNARTEPQNGNVENQLRMTLDENTGTLGQCL
ncbi:selenocysteine insertion sequence-binding protein 2 isoform X2 [Latimeria chalumnae]|uniref:selenocysteine insertion sequence-binding protein 2 isoform X2 n=1 Tax=Latimeria chalumnae TaxID=7897 RepID=UPI00313D5C4A